ncbi:MAG: YkgJ family cysteine cluster protein [Sphingobacteriales bacterium]|nr:MAG: YkgJ family cysteine cluster protein [Sphingobacteriales bacterium]
MDLQQFKIRSSRKKGKLSAFLKKLDDIVPDDFPALVAEVDQSVWKEVDCTACANCCKAMTPTFTKKDIVRISAHLGMTPKEFAQKWLHKEKDTGDWVNTTQPCQFLVDNKCSIYEVRPVDCAEFPHHNKKPFDDYNDTFTQNLSYCPATLMLVQRLKKRVEKEYEWETTA